MYRLIEWPILSPPIDEGERKGGWIDGWMGEMAVAAAAFVAVVA